MQGILIAMCSSAALFAGCAASGTRPHDMDATEHQAAAKQEDRAGAVARAQYDPNGCYEACWTDVSNPTSQYLSEAKRHEELGAEHRAASQGLRDVEASACVGVLPRDRDSSPFSHREDIATVRPLQTGDKLEGAVVVFRAVPRMTGASLQRIVDCHLARNAALGHDVPEMADCPLVPKDVTATVTGTDAGFAVSVRSDNSDSANEILRRAQTLVAH